MSEKIPSYLADAKPNPQENRAPWYSNTAPTYAGVFLWFVFWNTIMSNVFFGNGLSQGVVYPILGVVAAALISHFMFFLAPALYGMKTGMNLYVIGSSSFGAKGAIIMPGLLMGILQFGWLSVNAWFSSKLLAAPFSFMDPDTLSRILMVIFGFGAVFVGLKGIQYVAKISTFLPLIPLGILIFLLYKTLPTLGDFDPAVLANAAGELKPVISIFAVIALVIGSVLGYFATAGAAGVDIGTAARNKKDVQLGGLVGIALVITVVSVLGILVLAGACGNPEVVSALNNMDPNKDILVSVIMCALVGAKTGKILMFLLALAAFAGGCFSALIAVNSFKTMMPRVNPYISAFVGGGAAVLLAVTDVAGNAAAVFTIVGVSFGPICGVMTAEFLKNKGEWTGSRKGFNPAGIFAWAVGFGVGIIPIIFPEKGLPDATLVAYILGFVVYYVASTIGLESSKLKK